MSKGILDKIQEIEIKLNKLKQLDRNLNFYGSKNHKYILNSPLSIGEVELFEEKYSIILPEGYKQFLINLGNGGAGPGSGMFPLEKFNANCVSYKYKEYPFPEEYISLPFPHKEKWCPKFESEDEFEDDHRKSLLGTICLSHGGCGYFDLLIVNGQESGNVWADGYVSDQGITPIVSKIDGKRKDFLDWYESWLDENVR